LFLYVWLHLQGGRADVPQWVELANGCLCCSVKAEFVQALEVLLGQGSQHAGKFDYVLVETTGEACPGYVVGMLSAACFCALLPVAASRPVCGRGSQRAGRL
jgi:G3E family GTPase